MLSAHGCMGVVLFQKLILNEWGVGFFSSTKVGNHSFKTSVEWLGVKNL